MAKVVGLGAIALAILVTSACQRKPSEDPFGPAATARALKEVCEAYTDAAQRIPDPERAHQYVHDNFDTSWPVLLKMMAGVQLIDPRQRYSMWLFLARNEKDLPSWSCPALDRLLLRIVAKQPPVPNKYLPSATVSVSAAGDVTIDGQRVDLAAAREAFKGFAQHLTSVFVFREGWERKMPPNADAVLTGLIAVGRRFAVCARPSCLP